MRKDHVGGTRKVGVRIPDPSKAVDTESAQEDTGD